jgi:hypothetical protein
MNYLGKCVRKVYWPFPYFITGGLFFFIILISEITTRTESRFKEAFVAMLAWCELASWITFLTFHFIEYGYERAFIFGAGALGFYLILNLVHAIVHCRSIVPQSLQSYKVLHTNYKCNTYFVRTLSYLFSFKFSLILVSYFFMRPQYKGDYSQANWRAFNRINLVFLILPYPVMLFTCGFFVWENKIFSYTGFSAIETIVVSTVSAFCMFIDAISALKCRVKDKMTAVEPAARVAAGADYESEDEQDRKKIMKRKWNRNANDQIEYGADEGNTKPVQ